MQLKPTIIDNFSRKGYFPPTTINKRQFHILMNTLLSQSTSITNDHLLFDQNLTNQIWKQAEQRIGKQSLTQIKVQTIVSTIVDAIQILTNRIIQCQELVQELKQKRQSYQYDQNFIKLQPLLKRMEILKKDIEQFQKDLKMLTEPFVGENVKGQLRKNSIKKKQTIKQQQQNMIPNIDDDFKTLDKDQQDMIDKVVKEHFDANPTKQSNPRLIKQKRTTNSKQQKNCAFYLLVFLSVLQASICMIKYDFMNLIVYILGFMILSQQKFFPHMIKISFWSILLSTFIDTIWLLTYMKSYLHLFLGVSIKKELKPYYQYVWFVTLLQCVLKLLLLYFVKSYELGVVAEQKQKEEADQEEGQQGIQDAYIPKARQMIKDLQTKTSNKH